MDVSAQKTFIKRAAACFADTHFLYHELADRLIARLKIMQWQHQAVLELGARDQYLEASLRSDYEISTYDQYQHPIDLSGFKAMCPSSYNLVIANLSLSTIVNWPELLLYVNALLKADGLFFFTVLGPDSLCELKGAFAFDSAPHVCRFMDMHDIGDALLQSGFENPVMVAERLTIEYQQLTGLFSDLRNMGWQNALLARRKSLTSKGCWQRMLEDYDKIKIGGKYPLTLEVNFGHAWQRTVKSEGETAPGEVSVPFTAIKRNC